MYKLINLFWINDFWNLIERGLPGAGAGLKNPDGFKDSTQYIYIYLTAAFGPLSYIFFSILNWIYRLRALTAVCKVLLECRRMLKSYDQKFTDVERKLSNIEDGMKQLSFTGNDSKENEIEMPTLPLVALADIELLDSNLNEKRFRKNFVSILQLIIFLNFNENDWFCCSKKNCTAPKETIT